MPWGAVGSIASAVGSLAGAGLSAWSANKINSDNLAFQREFAQNGVRWKVDDMRAAGLNPLLSTGINATSPAGGSSAMPDFSGVGASARDIGRMFVEKAAEKADAEIDAVNAQEYNLKAQAEKAKVEAERLKVDTQKAKAEAQSAEVDADYREAEKWLNGVGKVAGAGAAIGGGAYALTKFAPALTSSRQITGFAETVKRNPIPARVVDAIRAGGPKAKAILKKAVRVGGGGLAVWLLTEAIRKGSQYSFERESKNALEDKRREQQGKAYKSTFNIDRHF